MYDNNINTLRFVGAFLVLFGHTFVLCAGPGGGYDPISEWLKGVTAYQAKLPGLGVAMFFVLSGYLVTRSFDNRRSLIHYLEARALRIFPALWATLLLTVLVLGPLVTTMEPGAYFTHQGTWKYLIHNAKLYPDIMHRLPGVFMDNPRAGGVNGSLWTLPVEVRMYALVALLGVAGIIRRRSVFNMVSLLIVIWFILSPENFFLLHSLRHESLAVYFLLGALFYVNRDKIRYHWIGVAVLSLLVLISFKGVIYNLVYVVWFSYLVLYLSFHPTIKLPDLGKHGDFSYGLYLWAFPLTQVAILIFGPENPWFLVVVTFIATMTLAVASWYCVEQPALGLKGRLAGSARPAKTGT